MGIQLSTFRKLCSFFFLFLSIFVLSSVFASSNWKHFPNPVYWGRNLAIGNKVPPCHIAQNPLDQWFLTRVCVTIQRHWRPSFASSACSTPPTFGWSIRLCCCTTVGAQCKTKIFKWAQKRNFFKRRAKIGAKRPFFCLSFFLSVSRLATGLWIKSNFVPTRSLEPPG